MGKKRKRSKARQNVVLSAGRYETLLVRLIEAWEMADTGNRVYWDFGPGERPQKITAELHHVAKRASIPVVIKQMADNLELVFQESPRGQTKVRVRSASGEIKIKGEISFQL